MPDGAAIDTIARRFIESFNRRDADGLVDCCDPEIEFAPTSLVGARRVYRGHDGVRHWVQELKQATIQHTVSVREVRELAEGGFLVLSDVLVNGDFIAKAAMLARVGPSGAIISARAYLTDEEMLAHLGRVDAAAGHPA